MAFVVADELPFDVLSLTKRVIETWLVDNATHGQLLLDERARDLVDAGLADLGLWVRARTGPGNKEYFMFNDEAAPDDFSRAIRGALDLWLATGRAGGTVSLHPTGGPDSKSNRPAGRSHGSKMPANWLLPATFMLGGALLLVVLSLNFNPRDATRRNLPAAGPKIEATRMPPPARVRPGPETGPQPPPGYTVSPTMAEKAINLLRDPEFRKLPPEAQLYGLGQTDPEFGKLPAEAQQAVLDDPKYKPGRPITPGRDGRLVRVPPQVPPPTGANILRPRGPQGLGTLKIHNGTGLHALVRLASASNPRSARRLVFIRSGDEFELTGIAAGTYVLQFRVGNDWYPQERRFLTSDSAHQFDKSLHFREEEQNDRVVYSTHRVTLHAVAHGNARTSLIDESIFRQDSDSER